VPGFRLRFDGPFFNEFVLECPVPAERVRNALLKEGILAGVPLGRLDKPEEQFAGLRDGTAHGRGNRRFVAALGRVVR
jgi:hypothetical protein